MNFFQRLFSRRITPQLPRRLSKYEEGKARELLCPACHGEMREGVVNICPDCGKAFIIIDDTNEAKIKEFLEALRKTRIIK